MNLPKPAFWSRASLRVKGLIAVALAAAALVITLSTGWWMGRRTQVVEARLEQAYRLRSDERQILILLLNAEAGIRGYLLTGRDADLDSYTRARNALERERARLAAGEEPSAWSTLDLLLKRELDVLAAVRSGATAKGGPLPAATQNRLEEARQVMGRLQSELAVIEANALREIQQRQWETSAARLEFWTTVAVGSLVGPLIAIMGCLMLTTKVVRRLRLLAKNAQLLALGQPLVPSSSGGDEIARLSWELERAAALMQSRNAELEESERRFRLLFEEAPVAYHEIDQDGTIRRVNDAECRLLGYSREELVGHAVWEFLIPEQQETSRTAVEHKIRGEQKIAPFERQYVRRDGPVVHVEIHENPITGDQGKITGLRSTLLDITERKISELAGRKVEQYARQLRAKNEQLARALATAREATETKNRFLASMSHELRTPLNGIIGFSELMYDGKVGALSESHREFMGDILTSARHLLHLINDVLDLAKVESGRMEFRPERVDLSALMREVQDILRPLADKKQISIAVEPAPDLGEVIADASRFKQVLYNYLSNAVKFTSAGGHVTMRLLAEGKYDFRLEVEDTGVGIDPEESSRLFQEFHQISGGPRQEQGTGLGLALTKRIIEAQGGRVGLSSLPGKGSTFYAVLPRVLPSLSGPAPASTRPAAGIEPRMTRVLVIEDDPKDAAWLSQVLTAAGYSVQTSFTGADGLAKCQAQSFDAITLDLLLPDRSGWELLRSIRATHQNGKTPVIVVSLSGERALGAAFQVDDFLTKPVEAADLVNSLERAGAPPYGSQTVLVIDDDSNILKLMQATLTSFGYRALCATDGETGLRMASTEHPAAIILDLVMPVMDGFQFLEKFRRLPTAGRTPVFVWTNKDLTLEEYAQLEGLAQNVVLKRDANAHSILEQLIQSLPAAIVPGR